MLGFVFFVGLDVFCFLEIVALFQKFEKGAGQSGTASGGEVFVVVRTFLRCALFCVFVVV